MVEQEEVKRVEEERAGVKTCGGLLSALVTVMEALLDIL
jgi:hypothetical protein